MKKILLSLILTLLFIGNIHSQITLFDDDGNEIENNQEYFFGTVDPDDAKLHFYIRNDTNEEIKVEGKVVNIINSDGSNANFCMGQCLFEAREGDFVPDTGTGYAIGPNIRDDSGGTYFLNLDDSNDLITYTFKIYQINDQGQEIGPAINIKYTYDATLSVNDVKTRKSKIFPTLVKQEYTNITVNETTEVSIYNLQGKLLKSSTIENGTSKLDLSTLSTGIYLVHLKGESKSIATKKIVKQ